MSRPLPDGLVLRTAQPADRDQIATLLTDRGEAADAVDHRLVVDDPDAGWSSCGVVVDGDRVVSTAMLLDEPLILDGVDIPASQVELVATDREYEGRGLARALMGWAHEFSASRGHLAQVMIGIPYFYRQFGYQYAILMPQSREVTAVPPRPDGHIVRAAHLADIPAMADLQDAAQDGYDLQMPHTPACWRWLVLRDGSTQLLVERAGIPVATGRVTPPEDDEVWLGEVAAADSDAARALLAHAATIAGVDAPRGTERLRVKDRPGSLGGDVLEEYLAPPPRQAIRYYIRVGDVAALLDHLRPVLSARLAESGLGDDSGDIVVSFFRHHVRLAHTKGSVEKVRSGGTMQAPGSVGGAGVAPDLIGPLLFGPYGLAGLAERHADVYPGPNEALMNMLFPPVRADLLTFYLP